MNCEIGTPGHSLVGPHEGRELELMLAGEKPLAMFYAPLSELHVIPEDAFEPHEREGAMVKVEKILHACNASSAPMEIRIVLYALPAERWRIEAALNIVEPVWSGARLPAIEDDIEIGRLLGYSEEAIAQFIETQRVREGGGEGT